jgi:crossover junction endodeoxyribonuclease RuvC
MKARVVIGIDPGLCGAVAAIDADTLEALGLEDTPLVISGGKRLYDTDGMAALIRRMSLFGAASAVLEQAQAMPGQGVSSTFSTGRGFGIWEGILGALSVPYRTVRPSVWAGLVLSGAPGGGKARSVQFALRMFPGASLVPEGCRKPRDGRSDALCLAYYGAVSGRAEAA